MFSISRTSLLLLCLIMVSAGCQKASDSATDNQSSSPDAATSDVASPKADAKTSEMASKEAGDEKTEKEEPKPLELPKTVKGNWVLMLPQQQQMMPLYLFKISPPGESTDPEKKTEDKADEKTKAGSEAVVLLSRGTDVLPAKILSSKATAETVEFDESLLNEGEEVIRLNFQGTLDKGAILGNISFNGENCVPALLLPTLEKDMSKIKEPLPAPGFQEFIQAMQTDDPFKSLNEFTQNERMKTVPVALDAYTRLIAVALSQKKDSKTVEEIVNRYVETSAIWGKRLQVNALVSSGSMLARSETDASIATQYLDQAEKAIKEGVTPLAGWDQELALARARVGLKSDNPEQIKAAGKLLQEEVKKHPQDRELLTELVSYEKSHGSIDKAIEHLGILAGSPLSFRERQLIAASQQNPELVKFENPQDTLTTLWKKKHGSTEGLDEYLTKSFRRYLDSFVSKEAKEVDLKKGNRVSLIELFTGASCPPCVAADLATGVIESSFPHSKVIVLRYHQHIPAPDPLTNPDSEARFILYNHGGTPSTNLNGQAVTGVAGGVEQVGSSYNQLLEALIPTLSENTDVKIELSAVAKDGKLVLKANATGTEDIKEPLRLVAVLAEEELSFQAPNGINVHDMIVRSMLREPNGFPAVDGKLTLDKTISLNEFKSRITDYLSAFEEKSGANFTGAPLGLDHLEFVVFVQGELSKDVFQVASVPVSGVINFKSEKPQTDAKPETKPAVKAEKPEAKPEAKSEAKSEAKKVK